MSAGIGATRSTEVDILAADLANTAFQGSLDGSQAGLFCPAAKVRTVKFDNEPQSALIFSQSIR